MTVKPLALEEIALRGYSHVVTFDYTDLTDTAALTKTLALLPNTMVKNGTRVSCAGLYVETAFVGCATLTLKVGDGGDDDRFMTLAIADLKTKAYLAAPASITSQPYTYTTADTVDGLVTATTDNLTALSAGKAHVFLMVVDETTAFQ